MLGNKSRKAGDPPRPTLLERVAALRAARVAEKTAVAALVAAQGGE
jgi:hypothetical protein